MRNALDLDNFFFQIRTIHHAVIYAPYWASLLEAWNKRHHPNFLFLFYEDLKADLSGEIRKVIDSNSTIVSRRSCK